MRSPLVVLVLTVVAFAVPGRSAAAIVGDDPDELRPMSHGDRPTLTNLRLQVRSMTWRGVDRSRSTRLPRTLGLGETLLTPLGEWTELELELDGPAVLWLLDGTGAPERVEVSVERLVIALESPTEGAPQRVRLDLSLPASQPAAGGWAVALEDGLLAVPAP